MFMPVGIRQPLRQSPEELRNGLGIILANTYHLWLRPGDDPWIARAGGLPVHEQDQPFVNSGGFQVYPLGLHQYHRRRDIAFKKSPQQLEDVPLSRKISIKTIWERSCPLMNALQFYQPVMWKIDRRRTSRWAERGLKARKSLSWSRSFGIGWGAGFEDLRRQSAKI